ncbi:glycosyltransferase family 2 protein [Candidatus Albibeggiatoa sp. nov. NOAA]|uniref:glycosyltransferase family 2 protein n=1 Tax=Candidatus Albibeggiatoa sp. nov. NOAA TaxID=3162724 RepID=UPI0032F7C457|nr:glycosyltransferase family 2 protein [Thiotrichaceae bacterium]
MNLWILFAILLAAVTVFGTFELLFLTLGALLYKPRQAYHEAGLNLSVVIPAHNESDNISQTVKSLLSCDPSHGQYQIYVIADNCTDDTAEKARQAGAEVLERQNEELRGKGYALDFAFTHLLDNTTTDAIMVVDADTMVEPNFIKVCEQAFMQGAAGIQCRYTVNNPEASRKTRLLNVALLAFNVLRPRGRAFWNLSVGISGNGFGLTRQTLQKVPYTASSIVEDLEYHLTLVKHHLKVQFVDNSTVRADMPIAQKGSKTQRARWEGGRFRMIREHVPSLYQAAASGQRRFIEPLLDLLLLPLAMHVLLLLVLILIPFLPTQIYALIALCIVFGHVFAALWIGKGTVQDFLILLTAPFYILWKLTVLPLTLKTAAKNATWVRTDRDKQ